VTPFDLCHHQARYVLVSSYQAENRYGYAPDSFYAWVQRYGQSVYSWHARSDNTIVVYHVPGTECIHAPRPGVPPAAEPASAVRPAPAPIPLPRSRQLHHHARTTP
jgi:hypothetical protein